MNSPAWYTVSRVVVVAIGASAVLAPAILPPRHHTAYLPAISVPARATPARPPSPPTPSPLAVRPADPDALRAALLVPGNYVLPMPGIYGGGPFRVARDVTVDGHGAVTIRGGLHLSYADGARIRRLSVRDASGDAIGIDHTGGSVWIEGVDLTGAGDGLLDVVRSVGAARVYVRDSVLHDAAKCALIGHYDPGLDTRLVVRFERVTFRNCGARTPKVHRATVWLESVTVANWGSRALDVQLNGLAILHNVIFIGGPATRGPAIRTESGGRAEVLP